jgi:hypothetical protein
MVYCLKVITTCVCVIPTIFVEQLGEFFFQQQLLFLPSSRKVILFFYGVELIIFFFLSLPVSGEREHPTKSRIVLSSRKVI